MTQRWAIVDPKTKIVENCIIWDGSGRPPGGPDRLHIQHEDCDMDDTYDAEKNAFIKPPERSHK